MAGYSGAFYMGLEYMPVALTVVTFYTYPLVTGLFAWLTGQERFGPAGMIALPLAFVGLVLALDVIRRQLHARRRGLGDAGRRWASPPCSSSRRCCCRSAAIRGRARSSCSRRRALACIVATLASGEIWFPTDTRSAGAGSLARRCATPPPMTSILFAAAVLGATRVAVVMNVEPLASLVLTFLILGERLRPIQLVGALCVIAAIFLFRPRPVVKAPA